MKCLLCYKFEAGVGRIECASLEVDVTNSCSLTSGAGVTGRLQWEDPKLPQIGTPAACRVTGRLSNHIDQHFVFVLFTV